MDKGVSSEQVARQDDAKKALTVLRDAVGNISQGLSMFDADLNLLVCNQRFLDLLDFPESLAVAGTPFPAFARHNAERGEYGPGDIEELVEMRVAQARLLKPHQFERERPDGSVLEIVGKPLPGGSFISTYTDITERKQSAREMEKLLKVLHNTISNLTQGVSMYDTDLRLIVCNQRFVELLDLPDSLFVTGMPLESIFRFNAERGEYGPGNVEELVKARVDLALRFEAHLFERQRPNGRILEIHGKPLPDGGFVTTYTDITERKRSENALRDAKDELELRVLERTAELSEANLLLRDMSEMKTDFMNTVAHELRTPLTSIRALSEMLHDDPKMRLDDRARFLDVIVSETGRLTRLINEFLDLAKLESGRVEWKSANVDLEAIVRKSATALSQLFRDKECRLELDLPKGPWVVVADDDRLMQVVINLLSNAVKFVPQGSGSVIVSATLSPSEISVGIADNGPGVPAQDAEVIFEKFRQAGRRENAKPQGTGLGLPISREIIEHFEGRLWLDPSSKDGARFVFSLPLAPA